MKTFLTVFICIALFNLHVTAQRFIPLLPNESEDLASLFDTDAQDDVLDAIEFDGELLIGGRFIDYMGIENGFLLSWNGNDLNTFEPAVGSGTDRISRMLVWNDQLYIFGRLNDFSNAAKLVNDQWVSLGFPGEADIIEAIIYNERIILYTDEEGEQSLYSFDGNDWEVLSDASLSEITDIEVYYNTLYTAHSDGTVRIYDGNIFSVVVPDDYSVRCFSLVDDAMIISAVDVNDIPVFYIQNQGSEWEPLDISISEAWTGKVGHVYKWNETYLVNDAVRGDGTALNSGPHQCISAQSDMELPFSFGINEIIAFQDKVYAILNEPGDWHHTFCTLEDGNEYSFQFNGILHPYILPAYCNFMRPENAAGYQVGFSEEQVASGQSTIFAASPWYYAIADTDTSATAPFYTSFSTGSSFGPATDQFDEDFMRKYYRVWSLTGTDIANHQSHFADADYQIHPDIRDWPAHGREGSGEADMLAPFYDVNSNGIYDPEQGDYPAIKGDYCAFYIVNDKNHISADQFQWDLPSTLPVEMHVMHYMYDGETDAVNRTSFIRYKIFNRSQDDIIEFKLGYLVDFDIGNSTDDYIGCDTVLSYFYGYNGDEFDEQSSSSYGYQEWPAAQGVSFLNKQIVGHIYFNGGGGTLSGWPSNETHIYNYLNSKWKNGQPMYYGGNGVNGEGVTEEVTTFMFPSYPWEEGWNEIQVPNIPGDRRSIGVSEAQAIGAGECACIDIALTSARDTVTSSSPHTASLNLLQSYIPEVRSFYESQLNTCTCGSVGIDEMIANPQQLMVFPNPGKNSFYIRIPSDIVSYLLYIYNQQGQLVITESIKNNSGVIMIDSTELSESLYHLEMISGSRRLSAKWIKQY